MMRCFSCQFDNPPAMKFCGQCGTQLVQLCPRCGAENPPTFKFCGQCGTALTAPQPPDAHIASALEQFSGQCRTYPLWANHALASDSVMVASADATAVSSASRVRALAARKKALIFDQHCSIGFRSGEYGGR
jgi:ribosomal protein L40E